MKKFLLVIILGLVVLGFGFINNVSVLEVDIVDK